MESFIYIFQDLIVPSFVIVISMLVLGGLSKLKKVPRLISSRKFLIFFLILWTIIGFLTQEDFTERCGCLVFSRGLFSIDYILFSFTSLSIFTASLFVKSNRILWKLIAVELIYWLLKLLFIKSGYIGGLGIPMFGYYDFIGLTVRLLLLKNISNINLKSIYFPLISGLIITFKLIVLPCQENFIYNSYIKPISDKMLFERLNGTWEGQLNYNKDTTLCQPCDSIRFGDMVFLNDSVSNKDSVLTKVITGIQLKFNDSLLVLNSKIPKYTGKYIVEYLRPDYNYISYLPLKFSNSVFIYNDSVRKPVLSLYFEELGDKELILNINEFRLLLVKNSK